MRRGPRIDETIWIRVVVMAALVAYIAAIWVTNFVLLSPSLTVPMAATGWLFLPGLYLLARLQRMDMRARPPLRELIRPWILTAIFGAVAAGTLFLAIGWDVPGICPGPVPLNCFQEYQWSIDNGHYYQSILEGPRAEISRQAYIQEVGFDLRSAAAFGVLSLCAAWVMAAVFRQGSPGSGGSAVGGQSRPA